MSGKKFIYKGDTVKQITDERTRTGQLDLPGILNEENSPERDDSAESAQDLTERGVKHDEEKIRLSLVPLEVMSTLACCYHDEVSLPTPAEDIAEAYDFLCGWLTHKGGEIELISAAALILKGAGASPFKVNYDAIQDGEYNTASGFDGRLRKLPWQGVFAAARAFEYGAKKYAAWNWKKGLSLTRLAESCLRHCAAYLDSLHVRGGEHKYDEESGLLHLDHAAAAMFMLVDTYFSNPDMDDREVENG